MKKKFLFVSGIRSDYDLLFPLAKELISDGAEIDFFLCPAHFSKIHNFSNRLVSDDGFNIVNTYPEMYDAGVDGEERRVFVAAQIMMDLNKSLNSKKYCAIVYLGDREEPLIAAIVATYRGIPTIHIAGGDNCYPDGGDVDEQVRHSVSKLSSLHLVMASEHADRLMKMGEESWRICVSGNFGIERIKMTHPVTTEVLFSKINKPVTDKYCILIYHVMSSTTPESALHEFIAIVNSCAHHNVTMYVGAPNNDPGYSLINDYLEKNSNNKLIHFYKNLPREYFVSLLNHSAFIIGNSSLGILESTYLRKHVINVGERQKGRLHDKNIQFLRPDEYLIKNAISKLLVSKDFDFDIKNIYGIGDSSHRAKKFIWNLIDNPRLLDKRQTY